ncbi:hypothetical protein BP6252_10698 [Coleophoma cylindrospora]|uniref:Uncharacterized protein n=1 Tax=Coleophoma cylindrospora TaxID=1849047 RepID=A0A3D8QTE3_9HELO|nr:hypothetical protein BP6252_10698 [Coleophoma cylindrospora]
MSSGGEELKHRGTRGRRRGEDGNVLMLMMTIEMGAPARASDEMTMDPRNNAKRDKREQPRADGEAIRAKRSDGKGTPDPVASTVDRVAAVIEQTRLVRHKSSFIVDLPFRVGSNVPFGPGRTYDEGPVTPTGIAEFSPGLL